MRIIKEGKPPEEELFRGTCWNCKTEYECTRSEGIYSDYQRDGPSLRVDCPRCRASAFAYPARGGSLIGRDQR